MKRGNSPPHSRGQVSNPRPWRQRKVLFVSTLVAFTVYSRGATGALKSPNLRGSQDGNEDKRGSPSPKPWPQLPPCAYVFYILGSDTGDHLKKLLRCRKAFERPFVWSYFRLVN